MRIPVFEIFLFISLIVLFLSLISYFFVVLISNKVLFNLLVLLASVLFIVLFFVFRYIRFKRYKNNPFYSAVLKPLLIILAIVLGVFSLFLVYLTVSLLVF